MCSVFLCTVHGGFPRCSHKCSANSRNSGDSEDNVSGVGDHGGNSSPSVLRAAAHVLNALCAELKTSLTPSFCDRAYHYENIVTPARVSCVFCGRSRIRQYSIK